MRQHDGLDIGARGHLTEDLLRHVAERPLSLQALAFRFSHSLPLPAFDHHLLAILKRVRFGEKKVSVLCEFGKGVALACVSCEDDHAVERFEAVRVRFVHAAIFVEIEMGVLDRGHFDICVLEDEARSNVMTKKNLRQRDCLSTVVDPDLGADGEILDFGGP